MKYLYILAFCFVYSGYSQNVDLLSNTWHLQDVVLAGQHNLPPINAKINDITAEFSSDGFITIVCNELLGFIEYINETFSFTQPLEQTFASCSLQENTDFELVYFSFYYNDETNPFSYTITFGDNGSKTLVINSASGDRAIYGDQILSNEVFDDSQFSIYPNPTSDKAFIEANSKIENIEVLDLLGRKVLEVSPLAEKAELNLGNLKTGIYIAIISSEEKKIVRKIVKE